LFCECFDAAECAAKTVFGISGKSISRSGHADRRVPLQNYCTGLLLPGERKSVEPMAARLDPENVRRMHQSLHHLVADAPVE
jgi:SRSO17 transposase